MGLRLGVRWSNRLQKSLVSTAVFLLSLVVTSSTPSSGSASPTEAMEEVSSFLVIKHSWKGKYKRVFSIGALSITTYNPSTMEATNTWQYR